MTLDVTHHAPGDDERSVLPAFYFDLASPEAYLVAERVLQELPVATEWLPIAARDLGAPAPDADELGATALRAQELGLQPLRRPDPFPFDSGMAMLAATYAKQTGRTVAFALAAFRQAFAGGRSLAEPDNVLIAASACEMHPAAVLKACATRATAGALAAATALAAERGVRYVPCIWAPAHDGRPGQVFHGEAGLAEAAAALAARVA